MYKVLRPSKDAYITDRVISGVRTFDSNTGAAGSLDLFKLYGYTMSGSLPNVELSRLLIHFDLDPLRDLISAGKVNTANTSFRCVMKLSDVYGGQPTPENFRVVVNPLSRSFDEGLGYDVVYYGDHDVCNFLTGSRAQGAWLLSGCNFGGGLPGSVDFVTSSVSVVGSLTFEQLFSTGEEDLEVDVTTAIKAVLSNDLPDEGFRIAFAPSHEDDSRSYFVKRFAARTAFNESKRPKLIVMADTSVQDDSLSMYMDSPSTVFLYNYTSDGATNLVSSSVEITGSNSLTLELKTEVSGGYYSLFFTGGQHHVAPGSLYPVQGVYSASFTLPSNDPVLAAKFAVSGTITTTPIWSSLDGTIGYHTGSAIVLQRAIRGGSSQTSKKLIVSVHNVPEEIPSTNELTFKVHVFDASSPLMKLTRLPVENFGIVVKNAHYQIRETTQNVVVVPFDYVSNSTKLSSDSEGMFFSLDATNLTPEKTYVVDISVNVGSGGPQVYLNASPTFKVTTVR